MTDQNIDNIQQPNVDVPQAEHGDRGGKMFTQEEVSRIVQERLSKQKAKLEKPSEREQALMDREARLACKEYLLDEGSPAVLLEVLDTSDPEKFKNAVELLKENGFGVTKATKPTKTGISHAGGREVGSVADDLANAFRPKNRRRMNNGN